MKLPTRFCLSAGVAIVLVLSSAPGLRAEEPDAKYRTPRATLRTLYVATDLARDNSRHVADAVGCLDLSGTATGLQFGGLLADRLETILTAKEVMTYYVPDNATLEEFAIPDPQGHRLVLRRMPDGHYRFDRDTVAQISRVYADMQKVLRARSQEAAALDVRPEFASPRATFRTFLQALRREDVAAAVSCLDLRDVPPPARWDVGCQMAQRLRQVIDRSRLVVFQQLPDANHAPPYVWQSQSEGLIELARQHGGERKGEWLFSAATVRSIDNLYEASADRPYVPDLLDLVTAHPDPSAWHAPEIWLREQLPGWARAAVVTTRSVHLKTYGLAGAGFLLLSAWGLNRLVRTLLTGLARGLLRLAGVELPPETLRRRLRPSGWLACVVYLRWGVLLLALDKVVLETALTVLNPLGWLCAAWALLRLIDLTADAVEARLATREDHVVTAHMLLPVGALVLKITLLLGTLFQLMHLFDWEITAVLTGLGIGGLAFALGAQDSLKNLFGSFTLLADRPFVVGERVKIGQYGEGVVEVVGLRSTRIRTAEGAVLAVPNSDLTTMHITNYGRPRGARYAATMAVVHGTPADVLLAFRDGVRELLLARPAVRKDDVRVTIADLGPTDVQVRVDAGLDAEDESAVREGLVVDILRLAESLGIEFAGQAPPPRRNRPAVRAAA